MPENQHASHTPPPFEAYLGDASYAFVSYAHQDAKIVFPEITKWNEAGFNLWYDEGIPAGGEWLEEIAGAIGGCSLFIVLISPRSVLSQYVKNEILFALDKGRPFLAIHLENTGLPKGLELCMSGYQALLKYEMIEDRYQRKLNNVLKGYLDQGPVIDSLKPSPSKRFMHKVDTRHLWSDLENKFDAPKDDGPEDEAPESDEPESDETQDEQGKGEAPAPAEIGSLDSPASEVRTGIDLRDHDIEVVPQEVSEEGEFAPTDVPVAVPADDSWECSELVEGQPFQVNEIEYPLLWVNPGVFVVRLPWNGEAVEVHVVDGFWLGERLVTQTDYLRIVGRQTNYFWNTNQLPVEQVSWLDCIEFCKALTALDRREGRLPAGYEFRLPMEIEWELACRAGSATPYFFGADPSELAEYAWVRSNSKRRTHDVAQKKPNPWGFYDIYGNVREWVQDSYYTSINESLAKQIPNEFRISRGGGYMSRAKDCESTARFTNSLFHRFRNLGFRLALSKVDEEDS